ncbi:hypothetical protein GCK72_009784 [Caenorhabditis remanei]|uniref:C2H2-type domain-containing protein n=1 Tax=Caenorhabditis remanei TaxID=31234 RepID=A0A6A5H1D5_CAERE|nr:hypothetical protein GCK72_009784 [Caenorhabditis remanei]KAF1761528.1 hypothetical protein GCK72_009784 [Caenorhabditis remanei]
MSTYIQVNIYNQTLDALKMRGIDLSDILKTIGCPNTHVTELPIFSSEQNVSSKAITTQIVTQSEEASRSDHHIPQISTTMSLPPSSSEKPILKKPFKSISAEISFVQPLNLKNAFGTNPTIPSTLAEALEMNIEKRSKPTLKDLFDDWDPTASLETVGTASEIHNESAMLMGSSLKIPKEEILDETDSLIDKTKETLDFNDSELANEQERSIIEELLRQQKHSEKIEDESTLILAKGKKRTGDESDLPNINYVITCNYPGCGLQYNWRVKYGKLRLLDHALTHSNRKIPCKLCGFECTNVRRMRSHYAKAHPNERVEGYGMKALVSKDYTNKAEGADGETDQQVTDEELKELWNACYSKSIHLVGHATGFVDGEKYRRMTKRRKLEREAMNSMSFTF